MKSFFDNFFGKKPLSENIEQPRTQVQRTEFELYQKGDVIGGKYEIQNTLGKGGFGIVHLVRVRGTGDLCALKTFRDELLASPAARIAFQKEALVWVGIEEHPYILTARWVDEFSGRLFVQMDYIRPDTACRVSLNDHLAAATGPLDFNQALEWAIQFCLGMEHAKAHGVECHRDIKPANILIGKSGTLRIADFGLAIAAEKARRTADTRQQVDADDRSQADFNFSVGKGWCGTPGYIAPEVFRCEGASPQSDIYSFGLVLWQMATGSRVPPFDVALRGKVADYLRLVYQQQITEKIPNLNGPLAPIIKQCLRFAPSDRFKDFEEIRRELEKIYQSRTGKVFPAPQFSEKTATFWNNKGGSLHAVGHYQDAIKCFRRALEINPHHAIAWSNMGHSHATIGQHEEAIHCFESALKINLRSANAWNNKGISLAALNRHDEAFGCFDQVLEIDPHHAQAWNNKGNQLSALFRHEEAIRHYDQAIAIDSKYAAAFRNKGDCLDKLGHHDGAINCYSRAVEIQPNYLNAWLRMAQCVSNLKRHAQAADCYERALELNPKDKLTWNKRGAELWEFGQHAAALECYDRAVQIDSSYADAWFNKALAHDVLKQKHRAVASYQKFTQSSSDRHNQHFHYAISRIRELDQEAL